MDKKSYIVAIDLGESTVMTIVGSKNSDCNINVDAIASTHSEGLKAGKIENIALVGESIKRAISEVENKLNIDIKEAYAGISGEFVRCARHSDHVFIGDPQNGVNQSDVNALFDRMRNVHAPDGETIMERIAQNYIVDTDQEVNNPVGSFGRQLSSTFNFILCANTPMQRLEMALRRTNIRMVKSYANALAVSEAVLSEDEKMEGVAVVDIGGGLTDIAISFRNVVRYIASIPIGSKAIDRDLRSMMIPENLVEKIKCVHGSAVAELAPEGKAVRVASRTPRGEAKEILLRNIGTAIEARCTDIAEYVKQELKESGYSNKLTYGIVLTGGGAQLQNISALFTRVTGIDTRVALPEEHISAESYKKVSSPAFATAVGLLIKGMEMGPCATTERATPAKRSERVAESTTTLQDVALSAEPNIIEQKIEEVTVEKTKPYVATSTAPRTTSEELQPKAPIQPKPEASKPLTIIEREDDDAEEEREEEREESNGKIGNFFSRSIQRFYDKFNSNDDVEI